MLEVNCFTSSRENGRSDVPQGTAEPLGQTHPPKFAPVVKLADTQDLESCAARHRGSNPLGGKFWRARKLLGVRVSPPALVEILDFLDILIYFLNTMKISTDQNKIREILERGTEDVIEKNHLEKGLKSGKKLRVKFGIDPTGPKIHLGRAVPLRKLKAFQDLGHQIVLIVGDFTATIGDPSDKLSKRPMLTKEDVKKNMKSYKEQLGKILDIKKTELHYNSRWLDKLNLRKTAELAESFSLQQMEQRRNFKERMDKNEGVSLRECLYPLMQGYDSVVVKADVEIGGFDQLFNLKAGRIIQKHYNQPEQDILTTKMIEGTDGRKMSTSWGNVINIVDEPNDMFGKIMSMKDDLILPYFWLGTDARKEQYDDFEKRLKQGDNPRNIKMELGKRIVELYHSKKEGEEAAAEFEKIFSKKELPTDMPEYIVASDQIALVDLLVQTKLSSSKGEARRVISQGGVKIDQKAIVDIQVILQIPEQGVILQCGKRHFVKVVKK